jgi:hypothetical protein
LLDLRLRPFSVLYVEACSIPSNNVSMLVAQRHLAMKHCTILPVAAAHASFVFEDVSTRKARLPLIDDPLDIIGMNPGGPVPTLDIDERTARIFKPTPIEVIEISIGPSGVNQGGDGIDHYVQIALVRSQSLFGPFAVLDVERGRIPSIDSSLLIE